ncbi:MAG TPA: response regulator [Pseudolabrys sp.]|nr:response regulator [Pseudolabrys sp.]
MNKATILLAEDNYDDEVLTLRALRKKLTDVNIVVAHNGVEVLDYLCGTGAFAGRNPADMPNLLLLDLKMPMMDGQETLRRIRANARTSLLPVVILTSSDEQRDQIECYRLGANSYVCKPVRFDDFVKAATRLGVYWLEINRSPPPPALSG